MNEAKQLDTEAKKEAPAVAKKEKEMNVINSAELRQKILENKKRTITSRYGRQIGPELESVIFHFGSMHNKDMDRNITTLVGWEKDPQSNKDIPPEVDRLIGQLTRGDYIFEDFPSGVDFISKELERMRIIKKHDQEEADRLEKLAVSEKKATEGIGEARKNLEQIAAQQFNSEETGIPLPPNMEESSTAQPQKKSLFNRIKGFFGRK